MKHRDIIVSWLMLLAVLLLTVGCNSDDIDEDRRQTASVELSAYMSHYTDIEPMAGTRAGGAWIPAGYMPYSEVTGVGGVLKSNENAPIGVFFTQDNPVSGQDQVLPRRFSFSANTWRIDEEIPNGGTYQLYGYVPYGAATPYNKDDLENSTTIEPNGTYANGAILTLRGLNSVMNQDLCVVVGAKHGVIREGETDPVPATPSEKAIVGDFDCEIHTGENQSNHLFLLFDHLYAALRFRFRVDEDYAALRTIRLKKLELLAYSDEACEHLMTKKVKTTVTLKKKADGSSPIVSSVSFTPDGGGDMSPVLICNNESNPVILPSGKYADDYPDEALRGEYMYTDNMGFVPKTSSFYTLISIYDVYDSKDNLIRQNCTAVNKIDPRKQFNQESLDRGYMYTLRLTVKPTYLYVLSEPDLDNPTMVVN